MSEEAPTSEEAAGKQPQETAGKRVSWVELYFDLIFVFAVGQMSHVMVTNPRWAGFGIALGLFTLLWWTWIGFVVLYNRYGEDRTAQRLLVLAGTLPCAVAAVETHAAASGQPMAFTFALAGARLILAVGFAFSTDQARRVAIGYGVSTAGFVVSAFVPSPWRYGLWAILLIQEAGLLLLRNGEWDRQPRQRDRERPAHRSRKESAQGMLEPPSDPDRRIDAAHLSERFGLMMMILLGEVVVAVAGSAAGVPVHGLKYWSGLLAGLVLAAALWWIYFTAAAPISEYVLRASGGNPAMAYGLYAGGHLGPAFALLTMASGVGLVLSGHAHAAASWFITGGLASYLLGTRAVATDQSMRFGRLAQLAVAGATVGLAFLEPLITPTGVLLAATAWAVAAAAYATWRFPDRLKGITADPLSYFRSGPDQPARQKPDRQKPDRQKPARQKSGSEA
jgi:low temperature requirement protein LtrA